MDLGFETIGNACLICHDNGPVLATDPWIKGSAYFGSWTTSHEIPAQQLAHVKACKYLWISHGHPDHLSQESLAELKDKEILLPDHFGVHGDVGLRGGGRVARELREMGYKVRILKDGVWTQLAPRMRVLSLGDYNQDAALLVDLGGRLIVDSNDASDNGGGTFVRQIVSQYAESYLLALTGYGDADMINFFDEQGRRIPPPAMKHTPFLDGLELVLESLGIRSYVPFSSQHRYQRTDSAWANECATPPEVYKTSFKSSQKQLLPIFCRCDFTRDEVRSIDPPARTNLLIPPERFGDNWSDELEPADVAKIRAYFARFEHLRTFLGTLNFRVGGKDNVLEIERRHPLGITFETPRASLMTVVEHEIFDDLMIGNFTKTTLHGPWERGGTVALYPDFIPFVTKFGDNGGAHTKDELVVYFNEYKRRGFFAFPPDEMGQLTRRRLEPYLV
ncbi:MAG: MBL fold metallo-hydrolase [Planctomycetes bacterium]|nr:MBL fold metallo-hydrolase [Planctomycetota bacterium]